MPALVDEEHLIHLQMSRLCESFPSLFNKPGVRPWNQKIFAQWASGPGATSGSRWAAAFVLGVWNGVSVGRDRWFGKRPYRVPEFDVVQAMGAWDHQHAAAFIAWCSKPFWP
ncbi:hypothetical protein [Lacipirellula sp.]|uniref:hypothetical protein n=1 Tax=Lacipirellula sp. TaxID=2691419 RepID=UPI003D0E0235